LIDLKTTVWPGFWGVIVLVALLGILSWTRVKNTADYSLGGRKNSTLLVAGSLLGSFVGGTCIIGTAQASFSYGISAIWFTCGAGLSCLFLALFLAGPLRSANVETIPEFLENNLDHNTGLWANFYTSTGIFIQIAIQILAAIPLLGLLFPLKPPQAAGLVALLILCSVLLGGFWGTTFIGLLKMILLYFSLIIALVIIFKHSGSPAVFIHHFPARPWLNPLARGITKELGAGLSVLIGFTSTQSYLQALFAGRDVNAARRGALLSAFLIPPVGLAAAVIGLFMQLHHASNNTTADPVSLFILQYIHPQLGGVILGTLLISLVMTAAALTLGLSTMLHLGFYRKFLRPRAGNRELLFSFRALVLLITAGACLFALANLHTLILDLAFLSMALRGMPIFLPLLSIIFWKNSLDRTAVRQAILYAPAATLLWAFFLPDVLNPLYCGLSISLILIWGRFLGKKIRPVRAYHNQNNQEN
jgi:SSS family solute:Na+ symporter